MQIIHWPRHRAKKRRIKLHTLQGADTERRAQGCKIVSIRALVQ